MTKILAFAGRKSSGKNTAANFVLGARLRSLTLINSYSISEQGQLKIGDLWGDTAYAGVFDVYRRDNEDILRLLENDVFPYIKFYSFADLLKKMCIDVFGLHPDQCYGSDAHKNTSTDYKWEDMVTKVTKDEYKTSIRTDNETYKTGDMTAREILQYVGTNIFRHMYGGVWADATIRLIEQENTELAIITDCRFPNEVEAVQKAGGKVIRLTRNPYGDSDTHKSETALDDYDESKYDAVIHNDAMNIEQQNQAMFSLLKEWELVPNMGENI